MSPVVVIVVVFGGRWTGVSKKQKKKRNGKGKRDKSEKIEGKSGRKTGSQIGGD